MNYRNPIPRSTYAILAILAGLGAFFIVLIFLKAGIIDVDFPFLAHGGIQMGAESINPQDVTASEALLPQTTEPTLTPSLPQVVAVQRVEILAGPHKVYEVLAILETGQSVEIIGGTSDSKWWLVRVPYLESGQGWISAKSVTTSNAEAASVIDLANVRAVANVNIRNGPGMGFEKIGILNNGQTADVIGVSPDGFWWAISMDEVGDNIGWIATDYVVPQNTDYVPILQPAMKKSPGEGSGSSVASLTAKTKINIRGGPSTEFEVLGQLEQGQKAEVIGVSSDGQWWAIRIPGRESVQGWVAASFVEPENVENVPLLP